MATAPYNQGKYLVNIVFRRSENGTIGNKKLTLYNNLLLSNAIEKDRQMIDNMFVCSFACGGCVVQQHNTSYEALNKRLNVRIIQ